MVMVVVAKVNGISLTSSSFFSTDQAAHLAGQELLIPVFSHHILRIVHFLIRILLSLSSASLLLLVPFGLVLLLLVAHTF